MALRSGAVAVGLVIAGLGLAGFANPQGRRADLPQTIALYKALGAGWQVGEPSEQKVAAAGE